MQLSVVIVSYNTRDLLRDCIRTAKEMAAPLAHEILVVDNASSDGSAEVVAGEFPEVCLFRSARNVGFAAANNIALREVRGEYVLLLNSDAFPQAGSILHVWDRMQADASIGIAGGRLIGKDGNWQPSARMFPTVLRDLLILSGLSSKFARSRFFGQPDRTWSDLGEAAEVDWVPGAFLVIRRSVLDKIGGFDEGFYFYYEEVDLCRRVKAAGFSVWYIPRAIVVHFGGESAGAVKNQHFSSLGRQLTLWRMRSELLYYRKHHGARVWLASRMEMLWHWARIWRNRVGPGGSQNSARERKITESRTAIALMSQAWRDTLGGRHSPPTPW